MVVLTNLRAWRVNAYCLWKKKYLEEVRKKTIHSCLSFASNNSWMRKRGLLRIYVYIYTLVYVFTHMKVWCIYFWVYIHFSTILGTDNATLCRWLYVIILCYQRFSSKCIGVCELYEQQPSTYLVEARCKI